MVFKDKKAEALELWNSNELSNDSLIQVFEGHLCRSLSLEGRHALSEDLKSELDRWLSVRRRQEHRFLGSNDFVEQTVKHYLRWCRPDLLFTDQGTEALKLWGSNKLSNDSLIQLFETQICLNLSLEGRTLSEELKSELDRWLSVLRKQSFRFSGSIQFLNKTLRHYSSWCKKKQQRETSKHAAYFTLEHMKLLEQLENSVDETIRGLVSFSSLAFAPKLTEIDPSSEQLLTALTELGKSDPRAARFAVLRLFAGETLHEIASRTGYSIQDTYKTWLDVQSRLNQSGVKTEAGIWLPTPSNDILNVISADPRLLQQVSWREFERIIADLLARLGFQIELQQGTKDGGIDILALRGGPFGEHRYLIQAKRWTHKVGIEPVRQLLFLQGHYRATKGCLATTSTFTTGARELAAEYRWQLDLKDLLGIQEWVAEAIRGKA